MYICININLRWQTSGFSVIIDRESEMRLSLWVRVSACSHSQSMVNGRMHGHVCGGDAMEEDLMHALSAGTWSSLHVLYFFGFEPPTLSRWPPHHQGTRRRGAFRRRHALLIRILHGFKLFLGFSLYHWEYSYSTFMRRDGTSRYVIRAANECNTATLYQKCCNSRLLVHPTLMRNWFLPLENCGTIHFGDSDFGSNLLRPSRLPRHHFEG